MLTCPHKNTYIHTHTYCQSNIWIQMLATHYYYFLEHNFIECIIVAVSLCKIDIEFTILFFLNFYIAQLQSKTKNFVSFWSTSSILKNFISRDYYFLNILWNSQKGNLITIKLFDGFGFSDYKYSRNFKLCFIFYLNFEF